MKASSLIFDIHKTIRNAIEHHQAGRLPDAEHLYRAILQVQPNHPDANHNLGVLLVQRKQPASALHYFKAAKESHAYQQQYWLSYIDVLIKVGSIEYAGQILEQARQQGLQGDALEALAIRVKAAEQSKECISTKEYAPDSIRVQRNNKKTTQKVKLSRFVTQRGATPTPQERDALVLLYAKGMYADVSTLAQRMTECYPQYSSGWKFLGAALCHIGRRADALLPMQKAVALSPNDFEALSNLGALQREFGKPDDAIASCLRALEIKPDYAMALSNLSAAQRLLGKFDDAVENCRRALDINPVFAGAYFNMGTALRALGRLQEAEQAYRQALVISPDYAAALYNLGHVYRDLEDLQQAGATYQNVFDLDPTDYGLCATVYSTILSYLDEDYEQARIKHHAAQSILTSTPTDHKNARVYWQYLNKLITWHEQCGQLESNAQVSETLFVIGESHSLSAQGVVVDYSGQKMRCAAKWIEGCKQWHLGSTKVNQYKCKFEAIMAWLPRKSVILLFFGEIDCRHDEGIIKFQKKHPDKTLVEIVNLTVAGYINYVAKICSLGGHRIIVGGVPACNLMPDMLSHSEYKQHAHLIEIFNTTLNSYALAAGMEFLDVYALSNRGDGIANGEWHIDYNHLKPDAVVAAFNALPLLTNITGKPGTDRSQ